MGVGKVVYALISNTKHHDPSLIESNTKDLHIWDWSPTLYDTGQWYKFCIASYDILKPPSVCHIPDISILINPLLSGCTGVKFTPLHNQACRLKTILCIFCMPKHCKWHDTSNYANALVVDDTYSRCTSLLQIWWKI